MGIFLMVWTTNSISPHCEQLGTIVGYGKQHLKYLEGERLHSHGNYNVTKQASLRLFFFLKVQNGMLLITSSISELAFCSGIICGVISAPLLPFLWK